VPDSVLVTSLSVALALVSTLLVLYLRQIAASLRRDQQGLHEALRDHLSSCRGRCDAEIQRLSGDIDRVHQEVHDTILASPEKYVLREDFIRWSIRIEAMISEIHQVLFRRQKEGDRG